MLNKTKKTYYRMGAMITLGALAGADPAHAAAAAGKDFGSVATNVVTSISTLPGLLSALSYMFGILIGVLGVMKIKDHVENPTQTPLKDGAIRLAAGGALFALPIIYEAMFTTVGTGAGSSAAKLKKVEFHTLP